MGTRGTDLGKRHRFVDLLLLVPKVPRELCGITVIAPKPCDVAGESAAPRTDERSANGKPKSKTKQNKNTKSIFGKWPSGVVDQRILGKEDIRNER